MTLIVPGEEEARTQELLASVEESVRDLRRAFEALKERVEIGEDVKASEVKEPMGTLTTTLVNCQTLERKLADARRERSQIAQGGYALDFERARAEVLCALGRLRKCGSSEGVPE